MKSYDHKEIERKWQEFWDANKVYTTPDSAPGKENFYLLTEFPYPSGNLHVGHWYAFGVPDILARYMRMRGYNVMYPIGFDAFGLPAENAAIKNKLNPREWTYGNIEYMKKQMRSMGASFDWSRQVITCDPEYYKWTQWQFLKFFEKGLAYQKDTAVNWCPKDKTVLANEQVIDGRCERCDSEVEKKLMLQWNLKITEYADRLHDDLDALDWPNQIKESQRNWIGRSEGAEIDFYLDFGDETINARTDKEGKRAHITVFTTRPDTLYGATYLVLAPEHIWVTLALGHKTVLKNNDEVQAYVEAARRKSELERMADQKEKTGVQLEGVYAINPATGEKIPMFVADYVLAGYGTGAIMAVPAHDQRDYDFAKKYGIEIRQVIMPIFGAQDKRPDSVFRRTINAVVRSDEGKYLFLKWKEYKWVSNVIGGVEGDEAIEDAAVREVMEETGYRTKPLFVSPIAIESHFYADHKQEWRSRLDTPVLLELESDQKGPVSETERAMHDTFWITYEEAQKHGLFHNNLLALDLAIGRTGPYIEAKHGEDQTLVNSGEFNGMKPEEAKTAITKKFGRPKKTFRLRDWIVSRQRYWGVPIPIIHCKTCGSVAEKEENLPVLLPEIEDYLPTGDGKSPIAKAEDFVNVPCPKCGGEGRRETDTLDTFVDSSWYFLRYTDPKNEHEFANFDRQNTWMPIDLYSGGAEHTTLHLLYSRFWQKALYDLGLVRDSEPYTRRMNRSLIMGPDGQKMSKSRGNVIDPDAVVEQLGADTVRMYLAFIGPYNEVASYPWNPDGVVGVRRFLERVLKAQDYVQDDDVESLNGPLHKALKKIGEDIPQLKFNTAISQLMILLNAVEKEKKIGRAQWIALIHMLAPFAPHLAEELWHDIGVETSLHLQPWPEYEDRYLVDDTVTIAIQINGKTRGDTTIATGASKAETETAAATAVAARLEGKNVIRVIVVPNKLVNFVIEE